MTLHGNCILGKVVATDLYIAFTTGLRSFSPNRFEPGLDRLGPVPNGSVLVQSGPPSQRVVRSSVLEIHERTGLDRTVATLVADGPSKTKTQAKRALASRLRDGAGSVRDHALSSAR